MMNETKILLEKFKLCAFSATNTDFAIPVDVSIDDQAIFMANELAYTMRAVVYGEKRRRTTVSYPSTWLQHLKQTIAPTWFLAKWPVKLTHHHIEASALYPTLAFPNLPNNVVIINEDIITPA